MHLTTKFRLKITTKILLTLLGLSIVSLIIFYYVSLSNMTQLGDYALESNTNLGNRAVNDSANALEKQAEANLLQLATDQAAISNTLFKRVEDEVHVLSSFASELYRNPQSFSSRRSYSQSEKPADIYAASVYLLAPGVYTEATQKEIDLLSNMDTVFTPIRQNDANLTWTYIVTKSGVMRIYPWCTGIDPSFDFRERPYYINSMACCAISWTDLYVDVATGELMVTCYEPVYDINGNPIAAIGADVELTAMNERIINTQVGQSGYAFVIDKKGNFIARPGLSHENARWNEDFKTGNVFDNASLSNLGQNMTAGKTGVLRCNLEDDEKYIAYAPITSAGWSIGVVMPVEEIIAPANAAKSLINTAIKDTQKNTTQQITNMRNMFIATFVAILLIISAIAFMLAKRITKPILSLSKGAKIVGSGNLNYQLDVKSGDEIQDLANSFNKMTSDLKIHIQELQKTTAAKERIESELRIATEIQTSMVPRTFPPFPDRKEIQIFATMKPAKEIGGDFFDFFFVDENKLCLLIGDVCGKGIPAALFMAISKTLLKTEAQRGFSPDEILLRTNEILYPDNDNSMFLTVFCAILDVKTGEMRYANGGHNPPLIYRSGQKFEFITMPKGFVIGAMPDIKFGSYDLTLGQGDIIFMYTDGVTEAMNPQSQLFSEARLKQCLSDFEERDVTEIIHRIRAEVESFSQDMPQSDDITMLALRFKGREM